MTIRLVRTCFACPEQYDAFDGDRYVGYLRLRHGRFTVEVPDCGGQLVYSASTEGDGIFAYTERDYHLSWAVYHIMKWIAGGFEPESRPKPDVEYIVDDMEDPWMDFGGSDPSGKGGGL